MSDSTPPTGDANDATVRSDPDHSTVEEIKQPQLACPRIFQSLSLETEAIMQSILALPQSIIVWTSLIVEKVEASSIASLPSDDSGQSFDEEQPSVDELRASRIMASSQKSWMNHPDPRFSRELTRRNTLARLFDSPFQLDSNPISKPSRNSDNRQRKHVLPSILAKRSRRRRVRGKKLLEDRPAWTLPCSNLGTSHSPVCPSIPQNEISVKPPTDHCRILKYICFSELTYCNIPTRACVENTSTLDDGLCDEENKSFT